MPECGEVVNMANRINPSRPVRASVLVYAGLRLAKANSLTRPELLLILIAVHGTYLGRSSTKGGKMFPRGRPDKSRRARIRSRIIGLGLALLTALCTSGLVGISQAHADTPLPSWWSGNCDANNNSGSVPLGASYNGVEACGPGPTQGGSDHLVHFYTGAFGEYEWECVELVMRYMYQVYGVAPYSAPGGKDVVNNYSGSTSVLTKVTNDGTTTPTPGDILSFAASTNHPVYGHTAVVTSVSINASGNGTVTYMQQNASADGWGNVSVTAKTLGDSISGWLHNPNYVQPKSVTYTLPGNFSGNSDQDFAYATRESGGGTDIAVWQSNGDSGMTWQGTWLQASSIPFDTAVFIPADYNGDGLTDLYYATPHSGGGFDMALLKNTGSGFTYVSQQWNPTSLNLSTTRFLPQS